MDSDSSDPDFEPQDKGVSDSDSEIEVKQEEHEENVARSIAGWKYVSDPFADERKNTQTLVEQLLTADKKMFGDRDLSPETSESSCGLSLHDLSSQRSYRDQDISPSTTELAELTAGDRLLTSSGPSSLESLLRRSPRDTPVFLDSPAQMGSQGSLRNENLQITSLQDIALEEDEDDSGVYAESYQSSVWIYIGDNEELTVWSSTSYEFYKGVTAEDRLYRAESVESTGSEKEFRRRYQAVTHRMVHRKSSLEMYRRVSNKTFDCDKIVTVQRKSGEFGFRIHGSRPVVVSAIEPGTPAEASGLEVGDIIIVVNGVSVVDASHSEVVKIAHTGTDTLQLEVARTCHVLAPIITNPEQQKPICSGFLNRLSCSGPMKWYRRWFVLKQDNCLYYYKSQDAREPLGAIALLNHSVSRYGDAGRSFTFRVTKLGSPSHLLAADDEESMNYWLALLGQAATSAAHGDLWLEMTTQYLSIAAESITNPDCQGYLMKVGQRWKTWRRRYCVLKDGCLYFYSDVNATLALGVVHFHGYKVQTCLIAGKKYAFEIVPPETKFRHYYFHADNESEKKRWLAALEYSIDRWIRVG